MGIEARVTGLPDLKAALASIPVKLRLRALRNALAAGARVVQKEAQAKTPVLSSASAARNPYRTPGLVRKSIVVRTSKIARRAGDVGVFVNVKPAKGASFKTTSTTNIIGTKIRRRVKVKDSLRGAKSKLDPFYWRFINFGTKYVKRFSFLEAGGTKLNEALAVFIAKIGPQIQKFQDQGKDAQL